MVPVQACMREIYRGWNSTGRNWQGPLRSSFRSVSSECSLDLTNLRGNNPMLNILCPAIWWKQAPFRPFTCGFGAIKRDGSQRRIRRLVKRPMPVLGGK